MWIMRSAMRMRRAAANTLCVLLKSEKIQSVWCAARGELQLSSEEDQLNLLAKVRGLGSPAAPPPEIKATVCGSAPATTPWIVGCGLAYALCC